MPWMATPDRPKPLPPDQAECCQSDCGTHCVFEVYQRDLERWQDEQEARSVERDRDLH